MRQTKKMSQSRAIRENIVLPGDTNDHDTLFGGTLMKNIDENAAISARRHSGRPCVTASNDGVHFHRPIGRDQVVRLTSFVCSVGRTSMEVFVKITSQDCRTGEIKLAAVSYLTFVALGDDARPCEVPLVEAESDWEIRIQQDEKIRREARLKKRAETVELINSWKQ